MDNFLPAAMLPEELHTLLLPWSSASVDLAYLACGRLDAFYEAGLKPCELAADWLLVEVEEVGENGLNPFPDFSGSARTYIAALHGHPHEGREQSIEMRAQAFEFVIIQQHVPVRIKSFLHG